MDEMNELVKNISPPVTSGQADIIAEWVSATDGKSVFKGIDPWEMAISQFKDIYGVADDKWVKKEETMEEAEYPSTDYLVVEDPEKSTTWHLQVKRNGTPDHNLMGAAWAALHGGYRGNKYEGPDKEKAITKLKALYKSEGMETPAEKTAEADFREWADATMSKMAELIQATGARVLELAEGSLSMDEEREKISNAFRSQFPNQDAVMAQAPMGYWVRDVFEGHDEFGDSVIIDSDGKMFLVSYTKDSDGNLTFALREEWKTVERVSTYKVVSEAGVDTCVCPECGEKVEHERGTPCMETDCPKCGAKMQPMIEEDEDMTEAEFAESLDGIEVLSEGEEPENAQGPLTMRVQLIRPGYGNKKTKFYYPKDVLHRDAGVFEGAKMYETDHDQKQKSTRTWVSTVRKVVGFTPQGGPIGEVVVHDPGFAQRVRNLKSANMLEKMECSILGNGQMKVGKVDGKDTKIIEKLTSIRSVDWVTRAGAGGKALDIMESEQDDGGTAMSEVQEVLKAGQIAKTLLESDLPKAALARLAEGEYADQEALNQAIESEKAYLQEVADSQKSKQPGGRPFGLRSEPANPPAAPPASTEDLAEAERDILRRYF